MQNIYVISYYLGIRVSFGYYNNLVDVEKLLDALEAGINSAIPVQ